MTISGKLVVKLTVGLVVLGQLGAWAHDYHASRTWEAECARKSVGYLDPEVRTDFIHMNEASCGPACLGLLVEPDGYKRVEYEISSEMNPDKRFVSFFFKELGSPECLSPSQLMEIMGRHARSYEQLEQDAGLQGKCVAREYSSNRKARYKFESMYPGTIKENHDYWLHERFIDLDTKQTVGEQKLAQINLWTFERWFVGRFRPVNKVLSSCPAIFNMPDFFYVPASRMKPLSNVEKKS